MAASGAEELASGLSEGVLRTLVHHAPEGIFVSDSDGRYVYANDSGCRMLGYSREEMIGKTDQDLLPPAELERLEEVRAGMLEGRDHVGEWSMRRKDGSWLPVEVRARQLPNGFRSAFIRDISERKALEAERSALFERVERKRLRLQTVMDTLPLGLLFFDAESIVSANRYTYELLGMDPQQGQPSNYIVMYPDGRPLPKEALVSVRVMQRRETILGEEYLLRKPDGSTIPIVCSVAPIFDDTGAAVGAVGVFQDVSELMRLEQAVRENERLLKAVFELLPVGVWIANRAGRVIRINPAGERIWRGARYVPMAEYDEYKGWWADSGEPIGGQDWALARAIARGETSNGETVRIQCFDGSFKTIINWGAPIRNEAGDITGAVCVNEDITALYHTQEQLRAAVREREEILAVVTHDLRNPLSGLILAAMTAERKASKLPGAEDLRAFAAMIVDNARGMSALVDDLLAVATLPSGRSMLQIATVKASELLMRAARAALPLFAKAGIKLVAHGPSELPTIQVDANRILRVLANLLDNAMKFTEREGTTFLEAQAVSAGVRFSVSNTGPALSQEQLADMFQPFWQGGRKDRRGAGLGLSICRSIVEAHGGSIWAETADGMRVRVSFVLPRMHPSSHEEPKEEVQPQRG